jgi:hypothetical protein
MGLAGFDEGEVGGEERKGREDCIFQDFSGADGFGRGKAAAIYVHVEQIGAQHHYEESQHDCGED